MYHYYVRFTVCPKDKSINNFEVINGDTDVSIDTPITSMEDIHNIKSQIVKKIGLEDVDIFLDFCMLLRKDA